MVRSVGPREAEALIAGGGVDVVDVRSPAEVQTGHVPGARNVSLDRLEVDPTAAALGPKVLFVCARGGRSMTAAELAVSRGHAEVYSLDGGTAAWVAAGLPLERPEATPPTTLAEAPPGDAAASDTPELDALVGANVRALRSQRGYSLDVLAGLSGVGRQTLGQIELGRTVPSVSTLWKLARAFEVPFSVLLARPESAATTVLRQANARRLVSADGRFSSRALFSPAEKGRVEFYELWLAGHSREEAEAHAPGTRENLIVTAGRLIMLIGGERLELGRGDAIVFVADVPHTYENPGSDECWMNLVMTYAG